MREFGAFEAKNTFGSLLDLVETGEEVLITRHGRPVARLVPSLKVDKQTRALEALERIRERAKSNMGPKISWDEWKSYRDEGRL